MNKKLRAKVEAIKKDFPQVWNPVFQEAQKNYPGYPTWFLDEVAYRAIGEGIRMVELEKKLGAAAITELKRRQEHAKQQQLRAH